MCFRWLDMTLLESETNQMLHFRLRRCKSNDNVLIAEFISDATNSFQNLEAALVSTKRIRKCEPNGTVRLRDLRF